MTGTENPGEDKRIIIDEDWKARVEAEREELRRQQRQQQSTGSSTAASGRGPLPPPTLEGLLGTLGMQAMVALGVIPDPVTGKSETDLETAKYLIDTIAMLEEKTEGNRTEEESAALANLLHELRLGYVTVRQQTGSIHTSGSQAAGR